MDRTDGTGIAIMCHTGNLAELAFVEACIGDDGTDRGVVDIFVFMYFIGLIE